MLLADDERRCIDVNRAACSLLNLCREEVLSRGLDDFVSEEARPSLDPAWRELLETGSQSGEFELVTVEGARRTVEFRATAGVLPGCHLLVLRDVTGRTPVAEVRGKQGSFDFLAGVFEHIDEGLYVIDERRCFSFVNPAAARFLGYDSGAEMLGRPVHDTIHYKRPDGSRLRLSRSSWKFVGGGPPPRPLALRAWRVRSHPPRREDRHEDRRAGAGR